MQWLKLYDRRPLYTVIADKYAVREHISKMIGSKYLIPLIHHTQDVNEIRPENLPNYPFIIKTNHDSSGGIIIRDKSKADWKSIRKKLKKLLSKNYYYHAREWQYKNIKPRIVVEKLLMDDRGEIPYDYKVHCFNGKVRYIQVFIDKVTESTIYNKNWELQPTFWSTQKQKMNFTLQAPKTLDEMIQTAEILSADSAYLRVDLYTINDKIYFGELTLSPSGGLRMFVTQKWDQKLGEMLNLNQSHTISSTPKKLSRS